MFYMQDFRLIIHMPSSQSTVRKSQLQQQGTGGGSTQARIGSIRRRSKSLIPRRRRALDAWNFRRAAAIFESQSPTSGSTEAGATDAVAVAPSRGAIRSSSPQ